MSSHTGTYQHRQFKMRRGLREGNILLTHLYSEQMTQIERILMSEVVNNHWSPPYPWVHPSQSLHIGATCCVQQIQSDRDVVTPVRLHATPVRRGCAEIKLRNIV